MDEAWERAVESALEGDSSSSAAAPRTLTLDGAVKCLHGRLPPPGLLERFQTLEHLSIANVGVSSLEKFPRLRNLQRLILSDNRIAGGLEFLVAAGLDSLRDLDLSNNRIHSLDVLAPLASLRLVSLDLYECPVTRVGDYRSRVFGMIRSLKYLDKMDSDENERPETDEEEEDEDEEEEEEDPGSGEIDGEDRSGKTPNGVAGSPRGDDVVDVDEDDESDADEEETESGRPEANGSAHHHLSNGFRVVVVGEEDDEEDEDVDDEDEDEDDDDRDPGEEIDADAADEEDVVEVHDIADSDEEDRDGVEEEEDVEEDDEDDFDVDEGEDEEDVEDEEDGEPGISARLVSTDGEIDGHDQGEEDEDGEIGEEEEQAVGQEPGFEEEDVEGEDDEDDDLGGDFLVQQHIPQAEVEAGGDFDACNGEDEDEVDDEDHHSNGPSSSSQPSKRKRGEKGDLDDDSVEDLRSSKHR